MPVTPRVPLRYIPPPAAFAIVGALGLLIAAVSLLSALSSHRSHDK